MLNVVDFIELYKKTELRWFVFGWHGMINFDFFKKNNLYFLNGIIYEDHAFGFLLLSSMDNIYIYIDKLYNYRVRQNSIMRSSTLYNYCGYLEPYFCDTSTARQYFNSISTFISYKFVIDVIICSKYSIQNSLKEYFMPHYLQCIINIKYIFKYNVISFFIFIYFYDDLYRKKQNKKLFFLENIQNENSLSEIKKVCSILKLTSKDQVDFDYLDQIQHLNQTIKEKDSIINSNTNHINQLQSNIQEKSTQLNQTQS
ncbi:hypothetical protein L8V82_07705, partial [Campylobacter sp. IFREMER_LSEM_CL2151]|nr:hypothetical protein [Campylobacter sp. IFREMER_LSEM_CL2151]